MNHAATHDTTFKGYNFPKDSLVIPAVSEVHYDSKHFPNPERFDPDRFLDKSGRFVSNPAMIAFGIGKRECLGKTLAKQEIFLFTSCLVHQVYTSTCTQNIPCKEKHMFLSSSFHRDQLGFHHSQRRLRA